MYNRGEQLLCPGNEVVGSCGREKGLDRSHARASEVTLATEKKGQGLISSCLFSSDKTAICWHEWLDVLVEAGVEFVPELFTFAPAFPFRIEGVVRHDSIEHQDIACKT